MPETDSKARRIIATTEAQLRPRILALQQRNAELEAEIRKFKQIYAQLVLERTTKEKPQ